MSEQQKKPHKNVKGPVVKEFQWFQMETRLRKIIQQIVDPIQYQIVKNSSHLDKLQKNNVGFNQKIQYMLKMTTNDPEVFQKGVFKKIQEKFQKQQKTLSFLEKEVKNNTTFIDNKITLIDERMKESNDMITQIQQLKASNRQNLKNQTQKFDTIRKNIEHNVQKMSEAIQINQKSSRQKIQKLEKQISHNQMKMQNIFKQFAKVKDYFDGQKSINDDLIADQIKLKEQNRRLEAKLSETNKKVKQLSKIKPFLQDIQIDYKKVLFKVDNILPLINESQLNECLYNILPQKFHPRVAVYQFERYRNLNEKVLNRHFDKQPMGIDFNGQQLIRQAQQRNTRLLTKLKLKYYKNNGVELDFISFQQRQKLMNNFDYQKLTEIIDQLQQLQNENHHNKKNMRMTHDDVIDIVQKQLETQKLLLVEKIQTQIQHSKIDLKSTTEVTINAVDKLQNKLLKLSQKINQKANNWELSINDVQKIMVQFNGHISNNDIRLNSMHHFDQQALKSLQLIFSYFNTPNSFSQNIHTIHGSISRDLHSNKKPQQYHSQLKEANHQNLEGSDVHQSSVKKNYQNSGQSSITDFSHKFLTFIQSMKKYLESYQIPLQKAKNRLNHKAKSSHSKLTKAQQSQQKFKSHTSFYPYSKTKNINDLEKNNQTLNKRQASEFLRIPQFKINSGSKYCRQSHSSRLSMRKKPLFSPSKALFPQPQQQIEKIKNSQVRNSLSNFNELRKEHKRYLK